MPIVIGGLPAAIAVDVEQLDQSRSSRAPRARRCRTWSGSGSGAPKTAISPSPDHQGHDAAMAADRVEHQRVVGVEQLDRLLGRLRFRRAR